MTALEIVKSYYDAFNRKDYHAMLGYVSEAISHEPNQGEVRKGKSLFEAFVQEMEDAYDEQLTDFKYYIGEHTHQIAVEFTVNGIYKQGDEPPAHGQTYILPAAAFLEVNNGQITRVATFYNLPLWIKLVTE